MKENIMKIKVGLVLTSDDIIPNNTNENFQHSSDFNEKVYDIEEKIRSKLILKINESIGLHNWAIIFGQIHPELLSFLLDIYSETEDQYIEILEIVKNELSKNKFHPTYRGTVKNYIPYLL